MNLIFYYLLSFLVSNAKADFLRETNKTVFNMNLNCIQEFLTSYSKISAYKVKIHKREFNFDGSPREAVTLLLEHRKPSYTKVTFLNEGLTGIRNNEMVIEYNGLGENLSIHPGHSKSIGKILSAPIRLVLGSGLKLTDSIVLKDEHFTFNRTSFTYLSFLFTKHMESLKNEEYGSYKPTGNNCTLKYEPRSNATQPISLKAADSIFKLEEKYATLSFFILAKNLKIFSSLTDLFHRRATHEIVIPLSFMEHEISFDDKSRLPTRLIFKENGHILADYRYELISISK